MSLILAPLSLFADNPDPNQQPANATGFIETIFGVRKGAEGIRTRSVKVAKAANEQAQKLMDMCESGNEMACMLSGIVSNIALRVAAQAMSAAGFENQVSLDPLTPDITKNAQEQMQAAVDRLAELKKQGFTFAPDGTITLPNKKTIHISEINNRNLLIAAGFHTNDIDVLLTKLDTALAVIGGRLPQVVQSVDVFKDPLPQTPIQPTTQDVAANSNAFGGGSSLEGLSIDFQGTPIGVASADLFNIVTIVFGAIQTSGGTITEESPNTAE